MNEVYVVDKEFLFKTDVNSVTSISIEHSYDVENSNLVGEFIISGDYRLHEASINKEDFSFKVPFDMGIRSNVNLDTVEVEITDFSYTVNGDELSVHIEYLVTGEQSLIEFAEESDLEDFLKNNEAEIIDLSNEERIDEDLSKTIESKYSFVKNDQEDMRAEKIKGEDDSANKEAIVNNIDAEESFVTYHVHTVTPSDTVESICSKYNIGLSDLKKWNNVDELTVNSKLIIADEES